MKTEKLPLIQHLTELRQRLIYSVILFVAAFFIAYYFSQSLFDYLVQPLSDILKNKGADRRLIYTNVTEAFSTYVKVSAFFAFFITFPFTAVQVWKFIVPGLYQNEKVLFRYFLLITPFLFLSGALFAYHIIFPNAYAFFLSFEAPATVGHLPIQLEAKISEYLSFVMRLILAFGICFELPVILSLLAWGKFVTYSSLKKHWRIAIVLIFTIAALITPPNVLSMVGLALPLIGLYGVSLILVKWIEKNMQQAKP